MITEDGEVILEKIERARGSDIGDSEWGLTDVALCLPPSPGIGCFEALFTDTLRERVSIRS